MLAPTRLLRRRRHDHTRVHTCRATATLRAGIPLKTLSDRKIHRQWHRLLPPKLKKGQKRSKDAGKKRGRIDLAARWVHNPKLVVPLPPELQASELHFDRPANEVQIFLVRAAGLPIMDRSLMSKGGSSDPVVSFECCGEKAQSSMPRSIAWTSCDRRLSQL